VKLASAKDVVTVLCFAETCCSLCAWDALGVWPVGESAGVGRSEDGKLFRHFDYPPELHGLVERSERFHAHRVPLSHHHYRAKIENLRRELRLLVNAVRLVALAVAALWRREASEDPWKARTK
jgi:hypothetical protein